MINYEEWRPCLLDYSEDDQWGRNKWKKERNNHEQGNEILREEHRREIARLMFSMFLKIECFTRQNVTLTFALTI